MNVFGVVLESAFLSVSVSVCPSVYLYVQNTSFCQSTGRGIKLHLVTALVWPTLTIEEGHNCFEPINFGKKFWGKLVLH